jgi:hypothetical protein
MKCAEQRENIVGLQAVVLRPWKDAGNMGGERNRPLANKEAEVIEITCTVNSIY